MTLAASLTCIGFLVFFQCNEKPEPEPEPQKIVCSFARAPKLTAEEKAATPKPLKRYVLKNEQRLNDNNCPPRVK
jgi:hypothetical protein